MIARIEGTTMRAVRRVMIGILLLTAVRPAFPEGVRLGLSATYYRIRSDTYREIYGTGGLMPTVSLAYVTGAFEIRADAGLLRANGAMTASAEKLTFRMTPLLFGVRAEIGCGRLRPYAGLGIGRISFRESYPERFEPVRDSKTMLYAEAGGRYRIRGGFHLDVNARYCSATAESLIAESIDLGGLRFGLGAVYEF